MGIFKRIKELENKNKNLSERIDNLENPPKFKVGDIIKDKEGNIIIIADLGLMYTNIIFNLKKGRCYEVVQNREKYNEAETILLNIKKNNE
jgi:hypothetical protein